MSVETDTRDKVIRLEVEMAELRRDFAKQAAKVDAMYDLLVQAKGARWLWLVLLASAGALGSLVTKIWPLLIAR